MKTTSKLVAAALLVLGASAVSLPASAAYRDTGLRGNVHHAKVWSARRAVMRERNGAGHMRMSYAQALRQEIYRRRDRAQAAY